MRGRRLPETLVIHGRVSTASDDIAHSAERALLRHGKQLPEALVLAAFQQPVGYDPSLTYVAGITAQNPAIVGSQPRYNNQTTQQLYDPSRGNTVTNLRLSLEYKLGDHTLTAGIDNLTAEALNQGKVSSGPGYTWSYAHSNFPQNPIDPGLGVGAPADFANGQTGYYVKKLVNSQLANVKTVEHALTATDVFYAVLMIENRSAAARVLEVDYGLAEGYRDWAVD